jgi:2-polyprenyl-6-methoxyphenol hydroxylase-like FAD-dependent oxidoreductase
MRAAIKRRDVLRMGGAGTRKKVIVIGAGIAGLSCTCDLARRNHDAAVLEASGRPVRMSELS